MERKSRFSERKLAGMRTHEKKQSKLCFQTKNETFKKKYKSRSIDRKSRARSRNRKSSCYSMSTSKNKDKLIPKKRYSIKEKMEYVTKYYTIKKIDDKKGFKSISEELEIPKNCLKEWVQTIDYMNLMKGTYHKYHLEGAGSIPDTIKIEEKLIKWVEEQRYLEIAINTNEIINKAI